MNAALQAAGNLLLLGAAVCAAVTAALWYLGRNQSPPNV